MEILFVPLVVEFGSFVPISFRFSIAMVVPSGTRYFVIYNRFLSFDAVPTLPVFLPANDRRQ